MKVTESRGCTCNHGAIAAIFNKINNLKASSPLPSKRSVKIPDGPQVVSQVRIAQAGEAQTWLGAKTTLARAVWPSTFAKYILPCR